MEKKTKEALRRYKKSRQAQSSSDSSSSSDSDSGSSSSYSSSSSDKKTTHRREKKKLRSNAAHRRSASSSSDADQRRKREKQHACQKKLEAKRNHIKRKLKEAKLKKRAAVAAAALGHTVSSTTSHRSISPTQQQKMRKLVAAAAAEKKHLRGISKDGLREREKLKAVAKEREHARNRSPTKTTKIRIHQEIKHKSPVMVGRHQLSPREKIIIQTRAHDRTPERKRELKMRHDESRERDRRDRERADREAARNKEREEALARCQERQRERERIAREKLRREEEKKYDRTDRLLPRPAERELAIAAARSAYGSRERSLDSEGHPRHGHSSRSGREPTFDREHEYLSSEEIRRRELMEREERRDREYLAVRHRDALSPAVGGHYAEHIRDERDLYPVEDRERLAYVRGYVDEERHRDREWDHRDLRDPRDIRDPRSLDPRELELVGKMYPSERERLDMERGLAPREWKDDWPPSDQWDERHYVPRSKLPPRGSSEQDWEIDELAYGDRGDRRHAQWDDRERGKHISSADRPSGSASDRRWQDDWRDTRGHDTAVRADHRSQGNYRRGGGIASATACAGHKDYVTERQGFRTHPPPLMSQPVAPLNFHARFPSKRQMTYTNPNLAKKQPATATTVPAANPPAVLSDTVVTAAPTTASVSEYQPQNSDAALIAQAANADDALFPIDEDEDEITYQNKKLPDNQELEAGEIVSFSDAESKKAAVGFERSELLLKSKSDEETVTKSKPPHEIVGELPAGIVTETSVHVEANKELLDQKTSVKEEIKDLVLEDYTTVDATAPSLDNHEEPVADDLSEISDSEDDILDKDEPVSLQKVTTNPGTVVLLETNKCDETKPTSPVLTISATERQPGVILTSDVGAEKSTNNEDDNLLDFEEISDSELEEDSRVKSVGDALGVDWASLIKETKKTPVSTLGSAQTTAKQKWQSHHIILDVGISMKMAGEEYAKRILNDAKHKLDEELGRVKVKTEIEDENVSTSPKINNEDAINDDKKNVAIFDNQNLKPLDAADEFNVDHFSSLACVQVSKRMRSAEHNNLIFNACGPNSRALSARRDLKLRRQLCGLPAKEGDYPRTTVSEKMKAIAVAAFQRSLEVK